MISSSQTNPGREIEVAFNNLERVLKEAGASWANVVAVNSYHVVFTEDVNQMDALSMGTRHYISRTCRLYLGNYPFLCCTPTCQQAHSPLDTIAQRGDNR
jgi:enamine deaminase RidA (YjgF/YER057c/UK114 family)